MLIREGKIMAWTDIARREHKRDCARYTSDLTDRKWALIVPLSPAAKRGGRPRTICLRAVMDAILYIRSSGWRRSSLRSGAPDQSKSSCFVQDVGYLCPDNAQRPATRVARIAFAAVTDAVACSSRSTHSSWWRIALPDDRVPVVEDFAGQFADLLLDPVAVALAVPLDARHQPLDGRRITALAVVDPLDEAAQVADEIATEAGARAVVAFGERQRLADEMRQTALAAGMIAIGYVAVGHQPAQESLADQRGEFLLAAAADVIDGRGRRHRHPHPAQDAPLIPGGLVEMDDIGRAHLLNELLDHGLAGQAEFVDAALDGRGSEFQAQPVGQEFLDLAPREAEAERQRRDESGEHRAHQAALAQLQIPPTPLNLRARPDAGGGRLSPGRTGKHTTWKSHPASGPTKNVGLGHCGDHLGERDKPPIEHRYRDRRNNGDRTVAVAERALRPLAVGTLLLGSAWTTNLFFSHVSMYVHGPQRFVSNIFDDAENPKAIIYGDGDSWFYCYFPLEYLHAGRKDCTVQVSWDLEAMSSG